MVNNFRKVDVVSKIILGEMEEKRLPQYFVEDLKVLMEKKENIQSKVGDALPKH